MIGRASQALKATQTWVTSQRGTRNLELWMNPSLLLLSSMSATWRPSRQAMLRSAQTLTTTLFVFRRLHDLYGLLTSCSW